MVVRLAVVLGVEHGATGGQLGHAIALEEARRREGLACSVEQRRRDRRSAVDDVADGRQLDPGQRRVGVASVEHHLDHGRRQHDVRDLLVDDGLQGGLAAERRQHDVHAAGDQLAVHRREVGQVEHRHGVQEHRVATVEAPGKPRQAGEGQVVVADHHALGETGGAAGVEHPEQRIAAAAHVLHRLGRGQQCLVVEHAFGGFAVASIDQVAERIGLLEDRFAHRLEGVVDDQHGRLRVVQGIDDLGHAPARIDRVQHTIAPRHAQAVLDVTLRVAREHGDAVAAGHAQPLQGAGQSGHALPEFGERHTASQLANGSHIGTLLHVAV
ncbi:hypothetical protein D9M68_565820 [compost metagenome]